MAVKKRKSNWYIYVITFLIALGIAVLAVQSMEGLLFPEKSTDALNYEAVSYLPSEANNMTTLVMLSEMKAGTPDLYMIVGYRPNKETIALIPISRQLKSNVGFTMATLTEHYQSGGAESVMLAIQNATGVEIDNYVKFDRLSFIGFIDEIGKVSVNSAYDIPSDTLGEDGNQEIFLTAGAHALGGEDLHKYLTYTSDELGEDYRNMTFGSVAMSVFNSNFRSLSSTLLQSYFNKIINTTDTDMRFEDYTLRQQAFMYTSENSYNPAVYYIPYGTYEEDGSFVIAESSVATIKDRLGITE